MSGKKKPDMICEKHLYANLIPKYPICGYILGVLTHTTAYNQHWGGDETLNTDIGI